MGFQACSRPVVGDPFSGSVSVNLPGVQAGVNVNPGFWLDCRDNQCNAMLTALILLALYLAFRKRG